MARRFPERIANDFGHSRHSQAEEVQISISTADDQVLSCFNPRNKTRRVLHNGHLHVFRGAVGCGGLCNVVSATKCPLVWKQQACKETLKSSCVLARLVMFIADSHSRAGSCLSYMNIYIYIHICIHIGPPGLHSVPGVIALQQYSA